MYGYNKLEVSMPWTLFYFLFIVLLFAVFSVFNLHNTCNISFLFYEFKDIPVYTAAVFSFILGTILSLPFFIRRKNKKEEKNTTIAGVDPVELKSEKKGGFSSLFKKKDNSSPASDLNNH